MAAHAPAAYGIYSEDAALRQIVQMLNQSGFEKEDICVMVSPRHPLAAVVREANILSTERSQSAVTMDLVSWLMKLGAVVIPTVGLFIRSQAFLLDLVMKKDSPLLCGDSMALVGLGFSEGDAERCESRIRELGVMVYVNCPESEKTICAAEVLRRTGAYEYATLGRETVHAVAA
jgi:hypothetical protein